MNNDSSPYQTESDEDDSCSAGNGTEVEWEISAPAWNDPFSNLKNFLRGFCVPDNPLVSFESDDCDSSTVYTAHSSLSEGARIANAPNSSITIPPSSILFEPMRNFQKVLFAGASFCDPYAIKLNSDKDRKNERRGSLNTKPEDQMEQSLADDCEFEDCSQFAPDEELEFEELIEIIPGTGRLPRVYKALETFLSGVVIIVLTIYILRRLDSQPTISIFSKEVNGDSLFLRIS